MNYELFFVQYAKIASLAIVFICVAALCVYSSRRNNKQIHWKSLLGAFSLSVLMLWFASEALQWYAHWRVSAYDVNGNQFFSNDGNIDAHLYGHLMKMAINDTGNALQPLGAIVASFVFVILGQALAYFLTLIRLSNNRPK